MGAHVGWHRCLLVFESGHTLAQCYDVTGYQTQPSKDAEPKLRHTLRINSEQLLLLSLAFPNPSGNKYVHLLDILKTTATLASHTNTTTSQTSYTVKIWYSLTD